jgi:ribosome-binding factor A
MRNRGHNSQLRQTERKAAQLCKQVQQALEYLIGDVVCELDASVTVQEVRPAPFTSHLLVFLQVSDCPTPDVLNDVERVVNRCAGFLRSEVAQRIHRKKAPTLSFCLVPS